MEKTSIRNYAARAARDLRALKATDADRAVAQGIADSIDEAIHFAVPDGGKIMNDELKGIKGETLRLPFPLITVEYSAARTKVVVVARETPNAELAAQYEVEHGKGSSRLPPDGTSIMCYVVATSDDNVWYPFTMGVVIPCVDWDDPEAGEVDVAIGSRSSGYGFSSLSFVLMGDAHARMVERVGKRQAHNEEFMAAGTAVFSLLEFLEALSCSNVRTEVTQAANPAKNARRIRDRKLPIYETRVLTVEVPRKVSVRQSDGTGTHASPREHLRRGHIRRLPPDHTRKIWVNAAVVGAGNAGRIDKTYNVRGAA